MFPRLRPEETMLTGFCGRVRLRVVSNFGDGDCMAGEIHTRAREISRRRDTKGAQTQTSVSSEMFLG